MVFRRKTKSSFQGVIMFTFACANFAKFSEGLHETAWALFIVGLRDGMQRSMGRRDLY